MTQDPSHPPASRRSDEIEVSLVEVLAPLRRRWRLILFGTGGCWAILLLFVLLAPPRYRCEATLALPNVMPPAKPTSSASATSGFQSIAVLELESARGEGPWKREARTGVPRGLYQKLERSLQDGAALKSAFAGTLEPAAIERLRSTLSDHVSPLASGESGGENAFGAVHLAHTSYSANRSRDVVHALASLLRETLITAIARERIAWEAQASERVMRSLILMKEELQGANRSLERLAADLERLTERMPESRGGVSREVVDTRGGGHFYLPPRLQLVGAKARSAANEHTIRTYEQALDRHELRLSFLRRLDRRMAEARASIVSDLPQVIASELKEFVQEQGSDGTDPRSLQTEMETLGDQMSAFATQTRFIQHPTVGRVSRTTWAAALASLAMVFFIAAAFMVDLWQRENPPGLP